MLCLYLSSYGR